MVSASCWGERAEKLWSLSWKAAPEWQWPRQQMWPISDSEKEERSEWWRASWVPAQRQAEPLQTKIFLPAFYFLRKS
jgi:hypothetical protein